MNGCGLPQKMGRGVLGTDIAAATPTINCVRDTTTHRRTGCSGNERQLSRLDAETELRAGRDPSLELGGLPTQGRWKGGASREGGACGRNSFPACQASVRMPQNLEVPCSHLVVALRAPTCPTCPMSHSVPSAVPAVTLEERQASPRHPPDLISSHTSR